MLFVKFDTRLNGVFVIFWSLVSDGMNKELPLGGNDVRVPWSSSFKRFVRVIDMLMNDDALVIFIKCLEPCIALRHETSIFIYLKQFLN